jgi:PTH1 family peptidyl-tRNA hydrolase
MKLVVGLGNPGRRYEQTRHNVGFLVVAEVARRCGAVRPRAAFEAETADVAIRGQRVLLVRPLTYMNRSGLSVQQARDFYKLPLEAVLVVCDDFNLPLGRLRIRASGSSGGQNGLKDIIARLGSEQFSRLRLGVGPVPPGWDAADFVLGRFAAEDQPVVTAMVRRAADAVEDWVEHGTAWCMNRYNAATDAGPPPGQELS